MPQLVCYLLSFEGGEGGSSFSNVLQKKPIYFSQLRHHQKSKVLHSTGLQFSWWYLNWAKCVANFYIVLLWNVAKFKPQCFTYHCHPHHVSYTKHAKRIIKNVYNGHLKNYFLFVDIMDHHRDEITSLQS